MNDENVSRSGRKLFKSVCVMLSVLAILWMALPTLIESSGTHMGYTAGTPDPNHYSDEYFFGAPLTWITWKHGWSVGLGYDERGFEQFQIGNFALHLLIIALPIAVAFGPARMRTQSS